MALKKNHIEPQTITAKGIGTILQAIATFGGIGYIKGGGSIAAFILCIGWYFLQPNIVVQVVALIIVLVIGTWSAHMSGKYWNKKDDQRIVIDEVAGMLIAVFAVPVTLGYGIAGFILFRFFDIVKPLSIRKVEQLPGGYGVMADDTLAGLYTQLILQAVFLMTHK